MPRRPRSPLLARTLTGKTSLAAPDDAGALAGDDRVDPAFRAREASSGPAGSRPAADFGWAWLRTLGEFDGKLKYDDPQVLWEEKRREDELRAAGWEVVRWTWAEIGTAPERVAGRLRQAFARAAHRVG